ncbi:MAG: hypothetical protein LUD54_04655 [Oscillospiraceae bacterium]|nr:hypothetical protein [Oscillospiraceae bacterium]
MDKNTAGCDLYRGCICKLDTECQDKSILSVRADYFIVIRPLDDTQVLTVPVVAAQKKDTKGVRINGKRYWARVMAFTPVPVELLEIVCGKWLDNPYQSISAIYDTHNRILAERKRVRRQEKYEQHQWKLMVRRAIKDQHEQERMNAPMEEPYAPDYIANHAKHPFSGGAMCPR